MSHYYGDRDGGFKGGGGGYRNGGSSSGGKGGGKGGGHRDSGFSSGGKGGGMGSGYRDGGSSYGGKGGGEGKGGGKGKNGGGPPQLWQPGDGEPPSLLSEAFACILPTRHGVKFDCPFTMRGLGSLFKKNPVLYEKMYTIVLEKTGFQLNKDPTNAQSGGRCLCFGKSDGFMFDPFKQHCEKKSDAAKQRTAPRTGGSSVGAMFGEDSDDDMPDMSGGGGGGGGAYDELDAGDGEEAAEQWVHAELVKHLNKSTTLEASAKRQKLEPAQGHLEVAKPWLLMLKGLPTTGGGVLNSQAALKQKFGKYIRT